MAGLLAPFGGITRIRFKGSPVNLPDSQPLGSPALLFQNRTTPGEVNATKNCSGVCPKHRILGRRSPRPAPLELGLAAPCSFPYLSAAACFTLVWKMACHPPFAIFQTDPALKVPEASFPS